MQSDCVTPIYDNTGIFGGQGKIYYQYTDPLDGEMYVFPEMDVMHLKTSMTLDGLTGIPVRDMLGVCGRRSVTESTVHVESV